MAIPAAEHCNLCDNADYSRIRHWHLRADHCGRLMYEGDFYCACTAPAATLGTNPPPPIARSTKPAKSTPAQRGS